MVVALVAPLVGAVAAVFAIWRRLWASAVLGVLSFVVGAGTLIGVWVYRVRNPCPPSHIDSMWGYWDIGWLPVAGLIATYFTWASVRRYLDGVTRQQIVGRCPECGSTMLRGERGCRFCARSGGQKPLRP